MTAPALDVEPACPGPAEAFPHTTDRSPRSLRAERRPFDGFSPETWDALAALTPWATPFSAWAFHRAWWDAFGANAHEETLAIVAADAPADADPWKQATWKKANPALGDFRSLEDVKRKGLELEAQVLSKAVQLYLDEELVVVEGKVIFKPGISRFLQQARE